MGLKVTFDPITKIIQIDTAPVLGVVNLDIKIDLYSDGKEDWRADANLFKYRYPVRTVGGDLTPTGALGTTFYLANGWSIRPYEGDHRLVPIGNLYKEDGSSPYTETVGNYNVLIEATVSNLIDQVDVGGGGVGATPQEIWDHVLISTDSADLTLSQAADDVSNTRVAVLAQDVVLDQIDTNVVEIHKAHFLKRVWNKLNLLTIFEADKTTPFKQFDTNDDLSDIDPQ
jgi:hypothetical protein